MFGTGRREEYHVRNSVGRLIFTGVCALLQIGWLILLFARLNKYSAVISLLTSVIAFAVALRIYGKHDNAAFKMPWIILLLIFPVMGLCLRSGGKGHETPLRAVR